MDIPFVPATYAISCFVALSCSAKLVRKRSSSRLTAQDTINPADEGQIIFDVGEQFDWKSGNGNKEILRHVEIRMCTENVGRVYFQNVKIQIIVRKG